MQPLTNTNISKIVHSVLKDIAVETPFATQTLLAKHRIFHLLAFDQLPSTMDITRNWPRDSLCPNQYIVVVAKKQTEGIGQKSNSWLSPPGNVYMTVLGEFPLKQVLTLSTTVAISICQMLFKRFNLQPRYKWINDVHLNNKKVAGVLVRSEFGMKPGVFVVEIGMGINVKEAPLPISTCLEKESGRELSIAQVIEDEVGQLFETIDLFESGQWEGSKRVIEEYVQYLGEEVYIYDIELKNVLLKGVFEGLNEQAHAMIRTEQGVQAVSSGRMRKELQ